MEARQNNFLEDLEHRNACVVLTGNNHLELSHNGKHQYNLNLPGNVEEKAEITGR